MYFNDPARGGGADGGGAMRCFACGCEMRVAQIAPDGTLPVGGHERRTLECPECGDTERRNAVLALEAAQKASEAAASDEHAKQAAAAASAIRAAGQSVRDAMNRAFALLRASTERRAKSDAGAEPQRERHDAILQIDTDALRVMPPQRTPPRPR